VTSIAQGREPASQESSEWTPARIFMLVSVLYHLPLAIGGLLIDRTFPIGSAAAHRAGSEHVFGIFETNGWHSVSALAIGLVSLYFLARPHGARAAASGIGLLHVGVVLSLALWPPETFWLASNAADQVVHTVTAVGGIGSALLTPRRKRRHG
jgi:hypothetical protein